MPTLWSKLCQTTFASRKVAIVPVGPVRQLILAVVANVRRPFAIEPFLVVGIRFDVLAVPSCRAAIESPERPVVVGFPNLLLVSGIAEVYVLVWTDFLWLFAIVHGIAGLAVATPCSVRA